MSDNLIYFEQKYVKNLNRKQKIIISELFKIDNILPFIFIINFFPEKIRKNNINFFKEMKKILLNNQPLKSSMHNNIKLYILLNRFSDKSSFITFDTIPKTDLLFLTLKYKNILIFDK